MKYLVEKINELSAEELNILEFHSLINILNVVSGELQMITGYDESTDLQELVEQICDLPAQIENGLEKSLVIQRINDLTIKIQKLMKSLKLTSSNLESIFTILEVRIQELVDRSYGDWETYQLDSLKQKYLDVLKAVEKNSKGRYGIKFDLSEKTENDYLVRLVVQSSNRSSICFPKVMTDVFRDLLLNSRKYTPIGGTIDGSIVEDNGMLIIQVKDNGLGIPALEVGKVANFGCRGSNVAPIRSFGGGFGLTKAFLASQKYSGSMWIDSEIDQGTTVTLKFPAL